MFKGLVLGKNSAEPGLNLILLPVGVPSPPAGCAPAGEAPSHSRGAVPVPSAPQGAGTPVRMQKMSQGWALEKLLLWFRWSPTEEKKIYSPRKASHYTVPLPETTVRSDLRNRLRPLEISDGSVPQSRCPPEMHKLTRLPAADANLANDRRPSDRRHVIFQFWNYYGY